ncbi:MAG: hypothetical protein LUD02_12270 [Tannerellaceae bacterium]|nr:hypothetical protein [Tannerellaceae bacterium]MCD8264820.1 hypothetical protein [Tannerellaceae bacterium]
MATGGAVIKCFPWLYTSFGFGYGSRELLWEYTTYSYTDQKNQEKYWAKNTQSSYRGVAAELDVMVKVAGPLYISAGCNTINFKYVDLNAGIGVFF